MTDDQLLERLHGALVPISAPSAPPARSLQDLRRAIDAHPPDGTSLACRSGRRLLPIGVAASVAAACLAVVVFASSLPRIGRETATRITVTVTSPAFGEVTDRQRALETALADGDAVAVATAAARLRLALNDLAASEWNPIRADVEDLLARADALLERRRGGNDGVPGVSPTMTSTTQVADAPATTQPKTSVPVQVTSPAAPQPTATAAAGAPAPSATTPGDDDGDDNDGDENDVVVVDVDDDNSGPGGGDPGDDNSGPGGGEPGDDNSGPGGGGGDSGSGSD